MSDENCGNCAHWKLWPPDDDLDGAMLCLAPLPSWITGASGNQATEHTDGTNCEAWEAKR